MCYVRVWATRIEHEGVKTLLLSLRWLLLLCAIRGREPKRLNRPDIPRNYNWRTAISDCPKQYVCVLCRSGERISFIAQNLGQTSKGKQNERRNKNKSNFRFQFFYFRNVDVTKKKNIIEENIFPFIAGARSTPQHILCYNNYRFLIGSSALSDDIIISYCTFWRIASCEFTSIERWAHMCDVRVCLAASASIATSTSIQMSENSDEIGWS